MDTYQQNNATYYTLIIVLLGVVVGLLSCENDLREVRRITEAPEEAAVDVSPDVQEHLAYLAETLNVPKWAVVEAAVRATTLETVEREFPEAFTDEELELPINVAA